MFDINSLIIFLVEISNNIESESIEDWLNSLNVEIRFSESSGLGSQENICVLIGIITKKKVIFLKYSVGDVKDWNQTEGKLVVFDDSSVCPLPDISILLKCDSDSVFRIAMLTVISNTSLES